ncbi:hypothetical protein GGX14DRAFT_664118 [Mycena pura]|uniref:DUF7330 domain-containing protein n=1 Tax=Mycena pura TaxID=153505 RepID=A0AAD6YL79_9AGAR|nr:hypothetical protein GGX14DRAFT_664118 [Mycena pura]
MLVLPDSQGKEDSPVSVQRDAEALPLPAYEGSRLIAPPAIEAANRISVARWLGEIKETFVLDSALPVPSNDKLHLDLSVLVGEVAAEVYVVGAGTAQNDKTRMWASTTLGKTKLVLHSPQPQSRAPIAVSVSVRVGEVILLLPRSFHGPLGISGPSVGEVTLSPDLRAASTKFGDSWFFIGEWAQPEGGEGRGAVWPGDEADVESMIGTVYMGYEDEKEV